MTAAESEDKRGDRDHDGRFLPGHRLGGRPRGVDLRALVEHRAAADPSLGSLDAVVWRVTRSLLAEAEAGSVAACKVLLDHLAADPDADGARDIGLDELLTQTAYGDDQRAERVAELLRAAAGRRGRLPAGHVALSVVTAVPEQGTANQLRTGFGDAFAAGTPPSPAATGYPVFDAGAARCADPQKDITQ